MRDAEDIINLVTDYLKEDINGGVTRINDAILKENAKKGDNLLPPINSNILIGNRLKEIVAQKDGWLVIDITTNAEATDNYDNGAISYIVGIGYVLRENNSNNTFLKSLRMQTVLRTVMNAFYRERQGEAGFMKGEVASLFSPEKVNLGQSEIPKIASGLIYNITIF